MQRKNACREEVYIIVIIIYIITPPARRAWRSFKFASLDFSVFFSVSEVGLPLMGDTAGTKLHEPI